MECEQQPKLTLAFSGYMLAYVGSMIGMVYARDSLQGSVLLWIACLFPALFAFLAMRDVFKRVMLLDELIRRIHMEAFMVGAGLTAMITFTWGLLEHAGLPPFDAIMVFPTMIILYGLALHQRRRAYQ